MSRRPAQTPLYQLLESLFGAVKGAWEDLFETRYGFWRAILDGVVARYLDCGISLPAQVTGPRPASATAPRAEIHLAFLENRSKSATTTPSALALHRTTATAAEDQTS